MSSPSAAARRAALASAPACRMVADDTERAAHFAIRRAVFCAEQGLFGGDDRDERDDAPATLHVVGLQGATIAGTVRLYPLDDAGRWKGDRLAVLPPFRHTSLGATLVRYAVRSAGERGGAVMVAMIQLPNVRFFQALGWRRDGAVMPFHGRDHQPMAIALSGG